MILFENSLTMKHLDAAALANAHTAAARRSVSRLTMSELDVSMSQALAGLTFPTDSTTSRRPFDPADLVSAVCPDPRLKVLQLATAPLSPPGGASEAASAARRPPAMGTLVDACLERLPRYDNCNAAVATLGAMAVARGVAGEPPEAKVQASLASLTQVSQVSRKSCQPCASLTRPFPLPLLSHLILSCPFISTGVLHPPPVFDPPPQCDEQARLQEQLGRSPLDVSRPPPLSWRLSHSAATALPVSSAAPRTLTVAANRTHAARTIEALVVHAELQLSARAYLHHYEQYGLDAETIRERVAMVQQVVDDYSALIPKSAVRAGA